MGILGFRGILLILSLSILNVLVASGYVERSELTGTWVSLIAMVPGTPMKIQLTGSTGISPRPAIPSIDRCNHRYPRCRS
jgi:hypothetical protein